MELKSKWFKEFLSKILSSFLREKLNIHPFDLWIKEFSITGTDNSDLVRADITISAVGSKEDIENLIERAIKKRR